MIAVVHVVVPAHDEARLLPGCLTALDAAVAHARRHLDDVVVRTTLVLDACTDDSASVAAGHDVDVVEVAHRNVGAARRAGVDRARALAGGTDPATVWIASTDADSVVPPDWLVDQVTRADAGADVVLGRVEPDGSAPPPVLARWLELHPTGHVGVHGAHLGFRLSTHDGVGGLSPLAEKEDLDLYQRMLEAGARYGAATSVVVTSSRTRGRTAGGFAGFIATLSAEQAEGRGEPV